MNITKERVKKEIVETVVYGILGMLIALSFYWALKFALHTSTPMIAVISYSMVPTFTRGDVLIVRGVPPSEIKEGDIIVFYPPGINYPIVHRVTRAWKEGNRYYYSTRGDANIGTLVVERKIPYEWVEGKVVCIKGKPIVIPRIGYVKIVVMEAITGKRIG